MSHEYQTISLTLEGVTYHIISYFTEADLLSGRLPRPSSRYDLQQIFLSPKMIRPSDFRHPPPVHVGPSGVPYLYVSVQSIPIIDLYIIRCSSVDAEETNATDGATGQSSGRRRTGQDSTSDSNASRPKPEELQTFMHRWSIAPQGVTVSQGANTAPAFYTLSFPQVPAVRVTQSSSSSSSSRQGHVTTRSEGAEHSTPTAGYSWSKGASQPSTSSSSDTQQRRLDDYSAWMTQAAPP